MPQELLNKALDLLKGAAPAKGKTFRNRPVRVPTDLRTNWAAGGAEGGGRITNLSASGCYVAAAHDLRLGDVVEVELTVPGRLTVSLKGPVCRVNQGEGFALRFRGQSTTQQLLLDHAVWYLSSQLEHNRPVRQRIERRREGSGVTYRGPRLGGCLSRAA